MALADIDLDAIRRIGPFMPPIRKYFRYQASGLEHVPPGPTLLVANHSGGKLPIDMFLFAEAWYRHFDFARPMRIMIHDLLFRVNKWMAKSWRRIGALPAGRENAIRVFNAGQPLLVLPGGDYETYRPYKDRYKIDFGRRTGFAELALQQRVPITPVVTIGSHELFFILTRGQAFAKALRFDKIFRYNCFPVTLGLPFGIYFGPLPSPLPLPAKITTRVLPPIRLWEEEGDHPAFGEQDIPTRRCEMQQVVTRRMQKVLDEMAAERKWPVIG